MTKIIARPGTDIEFLPKYFRNFVEDINREIEGHLPTGSYIPRVNISEDQVSIYVHAELPGLSKDDVKITVTDGTLTLRGSKKQEEKHEDRNFHRIERRYGEFVRQFTLPENVNEEAMSASFANGVLEVVIPKKEPQKPKEREMPINISVN